MATDLPDYTELLDRIDKHLSALHVAGHELFILADLKDDIVTLTDHVLDARMDAEGWEREARKLRDDWAALDRDRLILKRARDLVLRLEGDPSAGNRLMVTSALLDLLRP